jgi:hypothetical protein
LAAASRWSGGGGSWRASCTGTYAVGKGIYHVQYSISYSISLYRCIKGWGYISQVSHREGNQTLAVAGSARRWVRATQPRWRRCVAVNSGSSVQVTYTGR